VRCHEHKYDPITHEEYYGLYAYFNNVPEDGRALKLGNSPPYIPAPTPDQARQLEALTAREDAARQAWSAMVGRAAEAQREWEESATLAATTEWTLTDGLDAWFQLDGGLADEIDFERVLELRSDGVLTTARTEAVAAGDLTPSFAEAPTGAAAEFDGAAYLSAAGPGRFGYLDRFSVAAWVRPAENADGGIVSRMTDNTDTAGWGLHFRNGRVQVNLVSRWLDDSIRVETEVPLKADEWQHVAMTYDGSRWASGVTVYIDGEPAPLRVNLDALNQTFLQEEPLRIGSGGNQERFIGAIADVRVYQRALSDREAKIVSVVEPINVLAQRAAVDRTAAQTAKLSEFFLTRAAALDIRAAYAAMRDAETARDAFARKLPNTMVMAEREQRQQAHV
ncbi:MAG: LamG-like jellyroll fold domain-containing protein, partial [Pirellulales bacterium]